MNKELKKGLKMNINQTINNHIKTYNLESTHKHQIKKREKINEFYVNVERIFDDFITKTMIGKGNKFI